MTSARQDIGVLRTMRWIAVALAPGCAVAIRLALAVAPGAAILPVLLLVFDLLLVARLSAAIRGMRARERASSLLAGFTPSPGALAIPVAGTSMADFAVGMARLTAMLGGCAHLEAVPVDQPTVLGGARVAWWCEGCGTQLPAEWVPPEPERKPCDCKRCATGSEWWPVCDGADGEPVTAEPDFGPWFAARSPGVCGGCGEGIKTAEPARSGEDGGCLCFGCGRMAE